MEISHGIRIAVGLFGRITKSDYTSVLKLDSYYISPIWGTEASENALL